MDTETRDQNGRVRQGIMRRPFFWALAASAVAIVAVFAWEVRSVVPFVVDDSYITFSFSRNLALGKGPIYGHGMRVEGYSNFLWMVLIALPLAVARNADPVMVARILTIPFAALFFGATYALVRLRGSRPYAVAAVLLLAIDQDVVLAFLSGMESLPFSALVTAGFALYLHSRDSERLRPWVVPVLTAAALTRIDGFIPLGFVIAFEALSAFVERRLSLRGLVRWAAPGLLVWLLWFAWRYWYYGAPFPSTYYAKSMIGVLMPRRGAYQLYEEFLENGLGVALPAVLFLFWRRVRAAVPLALFAAVQLGYTIRVGGDWMPIARFILPTLPGLVVVIAWAAEELVDVARERGRIPSGVAAVAGALVWVAIALRLEPHITKGPYFKAKMALAVNQTEHVANLKKVAMYLSFVVPEGGRLVTDFGGVLAYYTQADPIEMWGLCNLTIARRGTPRGVNPEYGRTCPECYPELRPQFFHTMNPMIRSSEGFQRHIDVVRSVWQADTIGRYIDLMSGFATGRVRDVRRGEAVWFLEQRRPGDPPRARRPAPELVIEYPFEAGGLWGGRLR